MTKKTKFQSFSNGMYHVRIIKETSDHKKGDIQDCTEETADKLVKSGFAEWSTEAEFNSKRTTETIKHGTETKKAYELASKTNFRKEDLLLTILDELSKKHLCDQKLKLSHFIILATGYLEPAELHKSMAIKANRSEGKDNLAKTTSSMFPEEDVLFLTNATVSTLEDSIAKYKIVLYSEVNLQKDDKGANSHLVEVIKQLTEGGTSSMKKDVITGYKTTKVSKQIQKSVGYGTTETADDDELSTRFIIGSMSGDPEKVRRVNKNTCDWFAGKKERTVSYEWFKYGVSNLLTKNEVIIPFLEDLPKEFFDCSDSRSMRDVKRFLSCVSAVAWIHQLQRDIDKQNRIIAEPFDLLACMVIMSDFFNHTYTGLGDKRLQDCIDAINQLVDSNPQLNDNRFSRLDLQRKMDVSLNTVKGYLKAVSNLSIVRFHTKDGNEIYYERCQKGVNRVLMGVNWRDLFHHFLKCKGVKIEKNILYLLEKLEKSLNEDRNKGRLDEKDSIPEKIDTIELTPSKKKLVENVINYIKGQDTGVGVNIDNILAYFNLDDDSLIKSMFKEGAVFEHKPGLVKVLE